MLSEYNFEIRHIKGTANGRADALSRRPDYDQGHEDNQNIVVLPEQVFTRAMEVLPDNTNQEESTLKPWIDPHQLKQHQGVWYKDGRQVVTGDIKAKRHIIQSHHDSPVYGHPGISVTDLQGPPSERTQMKKIRDLKSLARQYARDQGSCDDTRISYLEYVESEAEADWTLARMIAG
jgi:hypothetical protein